MEQSGIIYYLCPDNNKPRGGVRVIYEHVDILNNAGFSAYVLHHKRGFRCSWFDNSTAISYLKKSTIRQNDVVVIPELYAKFYIRDPKATKKSKIFWSVFNTPARKIIFNQGAYRTFVGHSLSKTDIRTLHEEKDIVASMVISEDSRRYLNYAFPDMKVFRVHNSIDTSLFQYQPANKKKQICFFPKKNPEEFVQLVNLLKHRKVLNDWQLVPIENKSRNEMARILRESHLYVNLVYQEGFGLPSAEAMASGCIVIGYHGMGGKEFYSPEHCFPVDTGNIIGVAKTVESVLNLFENDPDSLHKKAASASDFIKKNYSPEIQKNDVIGFWSGIFRKSDS